MLKSTRQTQPHDGRCLVWVDRWPASNGTAVGQVLGGDCRGAILVPAVVMGALLVGALFYVAAVGDAIIFRTQLQDAADTTAFTSAVWHARGMNLIAVLNILMSFALAFFAVMRMVEILLLLIALIPGVGSGVLSTAMNLIRNEDKVVKPVRTALRVLKTTQEAVSVSVPYVALANAKGTPTAAETIWPVSWSLVPPAADAGVRLRVGANQRQEAGRMPGVGDGGLPPIAALPVQEDEFDTLCGKAVPFLAVNLVDIVERIGIPLPPKTIGPLTNPLWAAFKFMVDRVLASLGEAGGGAFCKPIAEIATDLLAESTTEVCGRKEEQAKEEHNQSQADQPEDQRQDFEAWDAGKRQQCEDDTGKEAKNARFADDRSIEVPPAKVWEPAANGNVFFHVWSYAYGTPRMLVRDQRFVSLAGHGERAVQVEPSTRAIATAEYYFDCETVWSECGQDSLWAPNWTARIRRYRSPLEEFGRVGLDFGENVRGSLENAVPQLTEGLISGALEGSFAGDFAAGVLTDVLVDVVMRIPLVQSLDETVRSSVGSLSETSGFDELTDPSNYTETDEERTIH